MPRFPDTVGDPAKRDTPRPVQEATRPQKVDPIADAFRRAMHQARERDALPAAAATAPRDPAPRPGRGRPGPDDQARERARARATAAAAAAGAAHLAGTPEMNAVQAFVRNQNAAGVRDAISDEEARRLAGFDGPDANAAARPRNANRVPRIPNATEGAAPPTPENLPAVICRELAEAGEDNLAPRWHKLAHLPGFREAAIRNLGRTVFANYTNTPIEQILTISTLANPDWEVRGLVAWIRQNGVRDDRAIEDYTEIFPGVRMRTQLWNSSSASFLLTEDHAGIYVYAWPGGRGVHLDHTERPALPAPPRAGRGPRVARPDDPDAPRIE